MCVQGNYLDKREVRQFQFTAWPDHGVPEHPLPLLQFIHRVKAMTPPDNVPTVVHCRYGIVWKLSVEQNIAAQCRFHTCVVKRSLNQFGDRCFATAGQTLWNSLPEQLRPQNITFGQFKRSLKILMFG